MAVLQEKDRAAIRERLAKMEHSVRLVNFTQELECATCHDTRRLLEEFAELSDELILEVYNFAIDKEKAEDYGVDKIPATLVVGDRDYRIRYFGIPSGYEFATLIDDALMVSSRDSGLAPESRDRLRELAAPLHLQVFVTPT